MDRNSENSEKIVEFLNSLIEDQPELRNMLICGIPANEAIQARTDINTRPCVDGQSYITISGIIYAIGKILGHGIATRWDIEDGKNDFVEFKLQGEE